MSQKRKTYSATFKAKVALAAQRQDKTISQLAAQFRIITTCHKNCIIYRCSHYLTGEEICPTKGEVVSHVNQHICYNLCI